MSKIDVDSTIRDVEEGRLPGWIADHLRIYEESGGAEGHMWDSTAAGGKGLLPCLLLHTRGRRSGRELKHPLIYGVDGDSFIIVASKGGADTQPGWYFNLIAEPNARVQVGTETFAVTARVLEGEERARIWAQMEELFPPYTNYQAKTSRLIPIFALDRR